MRRVLLPVEPVRLRVGLCDAVALLARVAPRLVAGARVAPVVAILDVLRALLGSLRSALLVARLKLLIVISVPAAEEVVVPSIRVLVVAFVIVVIVVAFIVLWRVAASSSSSSGSSGKRVMLIIQLLRRPKSPL